MAKLNAIAMDVEAMFAGILAQEIRFEVRQLNIARSNVVFKIPTTTNLLMRQYSMLCAFESHW